MLTANQENYLSKLPPHIADRIIAVLPYDPNLATTASQVLKSIEQKLPEARKFFLGAAALKVAGMNDIDISVIDGDFDSAKEILVQLFGEPATGHNQRWAQWDFERDGFPVEVSLNNDMSPQIKEQLEIYEILESSRELRDEYKDLKRQMNGKTYKEYQKAKYEFYNRILGLG